MKIKYPDYQQSILNVSNSILKHFDIEPLHPTLASLDTILDEKYKHVIYVLLDGLGVNALRAHLTKEEVLLKYLDREITSVFPPTTVAATDAVLSCTPPIENGHIGWTQYFPEEDVNLIVFKNVDFYDDNRVIHENLRSKYLSFERITDMIAKKGIASSEIFPSFMEGGCDSFLEEIERVLIKVHNTDSSFTYLYWTEPDLTLHRYGVHSKEVKDVITSLNNDFESLLQNVPSDTIVIAIADHGLVDINELNLHNYTSLMDKLVRPPSIEPRAVNFFVKQEELLSFKQEFESQFSDIFRLYSKEEFLTSNLLGYGKKHPMIDSFLGDYIGVAISDTMFSLSDKKNYEAHHAGLLEGEMMVPLIIFKNK